MTFALATPFFVALVLTVALVPLCRLLAHRTGVVAHPRNDRWHRGTIPLLGGVSIGVSLGITTLVTGLAGEAIVPLTAALLIFLTGLVDDFITLKPATKLIAQIALAAALVYFGYQLNWIDSRLGDSALTMLWVVGLTNAFNLLDNMDGLCAGTAFVVAVMLVVGLATGASPDRATTEIAILAALAGAVAGFLVYNFPPASIFMGDSGSLLLGFTLATFTLSHDGVRGSRSDVLSVIAGPVFVLLLPIFDTTLVTVMRLLSGRSPATGGRDHSSHRLVAIGLSERTAVVVLWSLAAVGGLVGVTLRNAGDGWSTPAAATFLLAVCLFAVYLARVRVYDEAAAPGLPSTVTVLTPEFMYKRRVAEVLLDFCLISLAYYGAYQLRFEGDAYLKNAEQFYGTLPTVLSIQLIAFFIVGVYRGSWHFFGLMDGVTIAAGVLLGTIAAPAVILVLGSRDRYSVAVFLIYSMLVFVLVTASRASLRLMDEFVFRQRRTTRRALVYGAGENVMVALRELRDHDGSSYRVIGFLDDDPRLAKMRVQGYPVLGPPARLEQVLDQHRIDTVVINRRSVDAASETAITAVCEARGLSLLRLEISIREVLPAQDGRQRDAG